MVDSLKQLRAELDRALDPAGKAFSLGKYAKTPYPAPLAPSAAAAPAAASVQPAPPPPAAATELIPAGITAKALQATWAAKASCGPATTLTRLASTAPLVAGVVRSGGVLHIEGACDLDGWIFDIPVYATGKGGFSYRLANFRMLPVNDYNLRNGDDASSNAPIAVLEAGEVDALSPLPNWGGIINRAGSVLNMRKVRCLRASAICLQTLGDSDIAGCWFGPVGLNCTAEMHLEPIKYDKGRHRLADTLVDLRGGASVAGLTAGVMIGAGNGPVDLAMSRCAVLGARDYRGNYAVAMRTDFNPVKLSLIDNALQAGTSGHLARTPTNSGDVTAAGNADLDTAASIDALLRAA